MLLVLNNRALIEKQGKSKTDRVTFFKMNTFSLTLLHSDSQNSRVFRPFFSANGLSLHENICCDPSVELPHGAGSYEKSQYLL